MSGEGEGGLDGRKDRLHSFFFFFSSRRRHTRLQGDWSSDVCSSDLVPGQRARRLRCRRRRKPPASSLRPRSGRALQQRRADGSRGGAVDARLDRPIRLHPQLLVRPRSEEHTSELQSPCNLVCRLLLEKKKSITATVTLRLVCTTPS